MTDAAQPRFAVSTWSLHRALGRKYLNAPANDVADEYEETWGAGRVDLLDLPEEFRANGVDRIEIVHFQMRSRDPAYLAELKASLAASGVTLQTLLIDAGDIADPATRERDIAWIGEWIDAAAALGAENVRVSGGRQKPGREALDLAVDALKRLQCRGAGAGVRVVTENWQELTSDPGAVLYLLDKVNGDLGLIADFGNFDPSTKYDDLASVMPRATSVHAKVDFSAPGVLDAADYSRCLDIAMEAGFSGPYTLIYSSADDDEWAALRVERDFIRRRLAPADNRSRAEQV